MNILFMGSSQFAVAGLKALHESRHDIIGVFTQQDKPKGRGYELSMTDVKKFASEVGYDVYTPSTLKDNAVSELLETLNPDVIVVISYGKILPKYVLDYPKMGCINIHASLLPKFRGAAPINFAIINGEKITGITSMYMDIGIDTGDMILKETVEITEDDNAGSLHDKLASTGAKILIETLELAEKNEVVRKKQIGESSYAPMIENEHKIIDFNKTSLEIFNQIRGLSPVPTAFATVNNKKIKIYNSKIIKNEEFSEQLAVGHVVQNIKNRIIVKTSDGFIEILDLQNEGKRRMTASEFLLGNRIIKFDEII